LSIPYRLVAWHAQQCAEKYIKAYLVFYQIDFPHTHRILYLLELCPERNTWGNSLAAAETLTPFAVMTRYPGEDEPVTEIEAKRAVHTAELVRKTIRAALYERGVQPEIEQCE
jgi:HEPN domain-containing protein